MEISEVDIPNGMIETQIDDEIRQFDFRMRNQGLDLEKYLEITGTKIEDMREQFREVSEKRVKADLVLEAIANAESIEVTEEDIDKELAKMAEQYKAENVDEFVADMKKGSTDFLKAGISNGKVIDFLLENAKFI
jgi:trigger factor